MKTVKEKFENKYYINEERFKVDSQYSFNVNEKIKIYTAGHKEGRKGAFEEMRKSYPFMTRKEIKEDLDTELKKMSEFTKGE